MADVLVLAGIAFTDFSPPERMGAGGEQSMAIHKLPGGSRVIDTLGPDEADISFRGQIFDDDALTIALALDAIRAAGTVQTLSWAGQTRQVILSRFKWAIKREPIWVDYEITCVVATNPTLGNLNAATTSQGGVDTLVSSDLSTATSINSSPSGQGGIGSDANISSGSGGLGTGGNILS
jgi:hypothetical protein